MKSACASEVHHEPAKVLKQQLDYVAYPEDFEEIS